MEKIPIDGFKILEIFKADVVVGSAISLGVDASGLGKIEAGANFSLPDVIVAFELLSLPQVGQFSPDVKTVFNASRGLDLIAIIGFPLTFELDFNIFDTFDSLRVSTLTSPVRL